MVGKTPVPHIQLRRLPLADDDFSVTGANPHGMVTCVVFHDIHCDVALLGGRVDCVRRLRQAEPNVAVLASHIDEVRCGDEVQLVVAVP